MARASERDVSQSTGAAGVEQDGGRIGSYTTARVEHGRVTRVERHALRLRRDAARLGLPLPPRREIERLFVETARGAFGRGDGIVRVEWSLGPGEAPELRATTRSLGGVPDLWRARIAETRHPGPEARRNTKHVDVASYVRAREEAAAKAVDEVLLFDADGMLVEGGHSNILLGDTEGRLWTPERALGGVDGLGLTIVEESTPELERGRLDHEAVLAASELMAVNAVRGVVPIVELDGGTIGDGGPGPWAQRLRSLFFPD